MSKLEQLCPQTHVETLAMQAKKDTSVHVCSTLSYNILGIVVTERRLCVHHSRDTVDALKVIYFLVFHA